MCALCTIIINNHKVNQIFKYHPFKLTTELWIIIDDNDEPCWRIVKPWNIIIDKIRAAYAYLERRGSF